MSETITENAATPEVAAVDPISTQETRITETRGKLQAAQTVLDEITAQGRGLLTADEVSIRSLLSLAADAPLTDDSQMDAMAAYSEKRATAKTQVDRLTTELKAAESALVTIKADSEWNKVSDKVGAIKSDISTAMAQLDSAVRGAMVAFGVSRVAIHADIGRTIPADGTNAGSEVAPAVTIVPEGSVKVAAFKQAFDAADAAWPALASEVKATGFGRVSFVIDGFGNEGTPNVSVVKVRVDGSTPKPVRMASTGSTPAVTGSRGTPVTVNGQSFDTALAAFQANYTAHPTYGKPGKGEAWAQDIIAKAAQRNMRKLVAEIPGGVA